MNLKTELYNHQKNAVKKLEGLRVGTLFMDMGTGKTRTILQIIYDKISKWDKIYYFCPCSIRQSIKKEIQKHSDLSVSIMDYDKDASKLTIIGIESLSNSDRIFLEILNLVTDKSFIIIDESILIKNHAAKRTYRLIEIGKKAKYRYIMCGTPISQGIIDLYSQFKFLSPKILGYEYFYQFSLRHLKYSEKYPGMIIGFMNEDYIAALINPYVFHVSKQECLDLPSKRFYTEYFNMKSKQEQFYFNKKQEILEELDYDKPNSFTIFKLFTELQKIVCGIYPFESNISDNPRLELLKSILERVEFPSVIFCKYQKDIENIKSICDCAVFHGKINQKEREEQLQLFLDRKKSIIVVTQQSGSYGLNLQIARTGIFYNSVFSYEIYRQSMDRIHRIGMNPEGVNYIDIICNNSIDEYIDNNLASKGNIIKAFKQEVDKIKNLQEKEKRIKELI